LVPFSLARREESFNTKFWNIWKFWSKLWLCAYLAVRLIGLYPRVSTDKNSDSNDLF